MDESGSVIYENFVADEPNQRGMMPRENVVQKGQVSFHGRVLAVVALCIAAVINAHADEHVTRRVIIAERVDGVAEILPAHDDVRSTEVALLPLSSPRHARSVAQSRRIAAVIVNVGNVLSAFDSAAAAKALFGDRGSARSIFEVSSFGLFTITGDIFGPLEVRGTANECDWWSWRNQAMEQLGAVPAGYDNVLFLFPLWKATACRWSGLAELGGREAYLFDDDVMSIVHELGHSLGVHHAATDFNDDGVVDDEYGDPSCPMGNERTLKGFNAPHVAELGWLVPFERKVKTVRRPGQYRVLLAPLEDDPLARREPQMVVVDAGEGRTYALSYRANPFSSAGIRGSSFRGVSVHRLTGKGTASLLVAGIGRGRGFDNGRFSVTRRIRGSRRVVLRVRINEVPRSEPRR